ncbi:MAG: family 10 glycosylhydrolase [Candidatus Gastranaerophilales bacterium]|nr:family 10 glycosylhydrolase [Candidatus Gastranaerophilales bacterium]
MKKLFCLFIVLLIGLWNFAYANSNTLDVNGDNTYFQNYIFKLPKVTTPKFETPNFKAIKMQIPAESIRQSEIRLRKMKNQSVKKIRKLQNANLLTNKKTAPKQNPANMKLLMTSPENVNIDVQKISFGNELSIYPITAFDPVKSNGNPGGRGINEFIVYTPSYGLKTGTNEYGKEAVIVDGRVVAMSSMDSMIPCNGFVISGHGKAKEWIEKNIIVGTRVDVNKSAMTVSSLIVPDTYVYEAEQKIKEAIDINYYYKKRKHSMLQSDFYIEKSKTFLEYAKTSSKNLDIVMTKKYAKNAIVYANRAIACSVPFDANELKGVWLRPKDKDPVKVGQILDGLKNTGIDNVFLETYYHGMTIYPSDVIKSYGLTAQRPEFQGSDLLQIWIEQAHKRNMKVHVWFQTFYLGNDMVSPIPKQLREKYPEWLNKQYWCATSVYAQPSKAEHLGYFLDPANPQVQLYLDKILQEIACRYDVDGINIDYIRYPASSPPNASDFLATSWGYTKYAMDEFKKSMGVSPLDVKPCTQAWCKWEAYRQNKVTNFVAGLQDLKKIRSNMVISAVIFPDKDTSAVVKLQDWGIWAQKCYVDAFTPLFLSSNVEFTQKYLKDMMAIKNPSVKVYAGLFDPFTFTEPTNMPQEIKALRELNVDGVILFDYAHFTKPYQQVLAIRAFNKNR